MQNIIDTVDHVRAVRHQQELLEALEVTYEEEARIAIRAFHNRRDRDADSMENYTLMFLVDYRRALNWKHTDPDAFLSAYAHRELAVMNGASEQYLDDEAYKIRQYWAQKTRGSK